MEKLSRAILLTGENKINSLKNKCVLVCGIGGVGSYVLEGLARMGVGHLILVDHDTVSLSNFNRQIIALESTLGKLKVEVAKARVNDIFKETLVTTYPYFINEDNLEEIFSHKIDYVVDAIDTVSSKLLLIEKALKLNIPIISSMGTGNRLDPSLLKIMDIAKTAYCPLARVMRYELRKRGIHHLQVLSSSEVPLKVKHDTNAKVVGSVSFVPSVGGLMIAGKVINDLLNKA